MKSILLIVIIMTMGSVMSLGQENNSFIQNRENMGNVIKVAAAQISPVFLDREKTVEKICKTIEEASKNGTKLIVFPEALIPGYPDWIWLVPNSRSAELNKLFIELVENSISVPDKSTDLICKAAKENKINVVIGINERNAESSNSSLYNSLIFINDEGKIIGKHRKLIPTGGERLIWARGDGSTLNSYPTSAGVIGGLICWENFMPLARNVLYEKGTQILAAPTWDKSPNWLISMQHIAREGGMFVISACMALNKKDIAEKYDFKKLYPEDREWLNSGNSCIIGPDGKIIAGPLEAQEGILYADIDLTAIIAAKRMFDVAGHYARPDVFRFEVIQKQDR